MNNLQFSIADIIGTLSLRKPQEKSLTILDKLLSTVDIKHDVSLDVNEKLVNDLYPTFSKSERDFLSLTFALATGVGKTRLMGAFITYLYTNHDIKNFFIVAPGKTIYEKLKQDLGNENNSKYVFKGLSCFSNPPQIITDDDYRTKQFNFFESEINIYIYNIDKFNQEDSRMRSVNENLGNSFFGELSNLDDLVIIMDESHHYRAAKGAKALNDLKPILGIELTATPFVQKGNKQVFFKNVVYEYPLSQAIADGYTRTPFAVTRTDVNFFNFGDVEKDKLMLNDGILCHEKAKISLEQYANTTNERKVKPFMLVVCKDTTHATWVENYIKSEEFKAGTYKNKTIIVHSNQLKSESDNNLRLLLDVEKEGNPVEIVIHVNKLKEGWDVNNLYTIVPLRSATSLILREQMVGRGLRLPYGERTGNDAIDSVMLTAHDKFNDILEAAQKGNSIFKAGNIIKAEELEKQKTTSTQLFFPIDEVELLNEGYSQTKLEENEENNRLFVQTDTFVTEAIEDVSEIEDTEEVRKKVTEKVKHKIQSNEDLGKIFKENQDPFSKWINKEVTRKVKKAVNKYIPIPRILVKEDGVAEYYFEDFDLDFSTLKYQPVESELIAQDLTNVQNIEHLNAGNLDFNGYQPHKLLLAELRKKAEIDYERDSELIFKLLSQFLEKMKLNFGENGMKNIVMMYKNDISKEIFRQMMVHFCQLDGMLVEEVLPPIKKNSKSNYTYETKLSLFEPYDSKVHGNIKSVIFTGSKKGVFDPVKFDSVPELVLARIIDNAPMSLNWLRPSLVQFGIKYDKDKQYQPDFVVETSDNIYLIEVKGEDKVNDNDVLAKKQRASSYCKIVNEWSLANGYKIWKHVFIPSKQILVNSSFEHLMNRFNVDLD
ncbi:DEAD/DEAH box helicase [Bacillus altitudinis]|uniref:DEAD/DEAH box helicase n=1 Tax=Bacillus altitudinis TaxID=293387 RepID=UPI00227FDEFA|nr:DEAD/DEAH box helicase family protein [Bacillus altitudinis]MCY7581527.1 DEAD/DEAH box helicase family protein [Bacillus altitudinis]MCY7594365.1 DEAD/DEAH box helicase family protein [Bacillus altitudinis]GLF91630.1 type III restriction endonuclease subunit R [Bacillus safensis]